MWKFKKETFCMTIFGSREKCLWQESSKCTQEMHGSALQALTVVGAAQGMDGAVYSMKSAQSKTLQC